MTPEQIARVCHEANRAYCIEHGDLSHAPWDMASRELKQSGINGVTHTLANKNVTAEQMHESWSTEKKAKGWKYGALKAPDLKEHPCLVPYAELPEKDRLKDELFLAVARALAPAEVVRRKHVPVQPPPLPASIAAEVKSLAVQEDIYDLSETKAAAPTSLSKKKK